MTRAPVVASYLFLGALLCWSRLYGLNHGYASDELMTVRGYVGEGPHEILFGTYIPNNHQLFSLLGWATTSLVGESEIALRLWSVVPFVVGAVVVTAWLHVRLGALSALLFLYFATVSPLLLDITRQARGYGLAFLAMGVLVVAALEAIRARQEWPVVAAFCGAGVIGTWTLPHLGIAFAATGVVLLTRRELRRMVAVGLAASFPAVAAWYAPHLDDLVSSSRQDYGSRIEGAWVVTAPIDQILFPGLRWIDEVLVDPRPGLLAIVGLLVLLMGSSPLLRARDSALVLSAGVIATVVTLWITRTNVAPRFFSFLLVPLLILLASGIAAILTRAFARGTWVRGALAVTVLGLAAAISAPHLATIPRLPRESIRDVGETIRTMAPASTPVFAYVPYPLDLAYYLGRPVETFGTRAEYLRVCDASGEAVFVSQPWLLPPLAVECTTREGARHFRFEQYARGGEVNVWLVPPAR